MNDATRSTVVVAVADITGFAKASRDRSDLDTFRMLDRFYHAVAETIAPAGGTLVKPMGDAVLMVFPVENALQATGCLQNLRNTVQPIWSEFGSDCVVRIHAHVGTVAAGPIGPAQQFDVIGNAVNELFLLPADGPMFSSDLTSLINA